MFLKYETESEQHHMKMNKLQNKYLKINKTSRKHIWWWSAQNVSRIIQTVAACSLTTITWLPVHTNDIKTQHSEKNTNVCFLWRSITLTHSSLNQPLFSPGRCDTEPRITVVTLISRQSCQEVFELFQLKWSRSYRCLKDVVKQLSDTSDRVRFRGFNSSSVCLKPPHMTTLSFSSSIAT